ncbi:tetratricopeptide repeat protein [Mycobacterium sp. Y57]|uniref:AAA family ATPase n=1 Tax=Mycolicibacterium xanthum TaxID=2796469 RepID=UPI001C8449DF|nr:LuxR family transcriptional regulator [Mycolicibacterium xanthum]MBX7431511.1 tetratricopeptide repeat protein [Mycolicibacterium xanthum]
MRLSWPLVGRTEELSRVEAALSDPDVSGIVICGEAGVGKSRIAREALSDARARGYATRVAVGTSSARAIPLGSFSTWAPPGVTDTVQLLRGVISALTAAPSGEPVVVFVDDVHLLDDLSTFVVHQIVQRGAARLILTVLDGKPIPAAVQEIWKVGAFDRLQLQPLSPAETGTLLSAALGGPADPDAARRLWQLTRGNVLYLRNIVEQEISDGRVERDRGNWRWVGDPVIPLSLVELIETRIGALPAAVADVIDTLAVGEPLELAALERITDPTAVEEAETRGLIMLHPTGTGIEVGVAHPIYGEVRRRCAPATKLRRLRGLVATELAASDDRDQVQTVVRRATLSVDSDLKADTELLTRAAHGAVWLADLNLADRLAEAAIRAGAGPEPGFLRAHALSWLGRGEDADAVLAEIDQDGLTDAERARLAFLRASNMLWALGDPQGAKALIDDAAWTTPPHECSHIDAFLAVYWFAMDRPDTALSVSGDLVVDQLPAVVGTELAWALTTINADAGRVEAAVSGAEAGYSPTQRSFDTPHMRFNIADAHVSALLLAGRIGEARAVAERVRRQAADLPGAASLLGAAVAGRAALGAGDLGAARALLDDAVDRLTVSHPLGWGFRYRIPRATALAIGGSPEDAAAELAALAGTARRFRLLDYEQSLARAWITAGQGAVSEAIAIARSAAERASASGRLAAEVLCLQTATQFGDRTAGRRLRELTALVEGPRAGLAARFAEALHDGDAAELDSVSEEFERIGDLVAAIDAAAHASLAFHAQALRGSALRCSARADALARRSGATTPALRRASEPLPLTDREHEIVVLIGEGLTNRDIAGRLTLSVRTVESHIYRAMTKTGTTCRDELAGLLTRRHNITQ